MHNLNILIVVLSDKAGVEIIGTLYVLLDYYICCVDIYCMVTLYCIVDATSIVCSILVSFYDSIFCTSYVEICRKLYNGS